MTYLVFYSLAGLYSLFKESSLRRQFEDNVLFSLILCAFSGALRFESRPAFFLYNRIRVSKGAFRKFTGQIAQNVLEAAL